MRKTLVLVTIFLVAIVLSLLIGITGATWCDIDFAKRINVSVNNTAGSALTNYQVYVNLSSNPINETSLRVYNSSDCTLRHHWTENETGGNSYGVWINYSAIAASSWTNNTVIYYNNIAVSSASNGTNTFEFFDEFGNDDSIVLTEEPSNPTRTPNGGWEGDVLCEQSDFNYSGEYISWYRAGASGDRYNVGYENSSDAITWTPEASNPILDMSGGNQYAYVYAVQDGNCFYLFTVNPGGGGQNMYLYNVTDHTNPVIMNSGNPVYVHSSTTSDWDYEIYNPGVTIDSSGRWHMLLEGKTSTSGFRIGYAYSNLTELNWTAHRSSSYVIDNAGNPYLTYIPQRNALLTLHGDISGSYWKIISGYANVSKDLTQSANWSVGNGFEKAVGSVHIADPDLIEDFNSTYPMMFSYNYAQTSTYQAYLNVNKLQFYDIIIAPVYSLTDKWTGDTGYGSVRNGILTYAGDGTWRNLYSQNSYSPSMALRARAEIENGTDTGMIGGTLGFQPDPCCAGRSVFAPFDDGIGAITTDDGGTGESTGDGGTNYWVIDEWATWDIKQINGTSVDFFQNDTSIITHTTCVGTVAVPIDIASLHATHIMNVDWILVRNYNSSEPNSTLGTEEQQEGTIPVISNVVNGSISPTSQYVDWDVNQTAHNRVLYSNESDLTPAWYSTWDNNTATPNITLSALDASTQYWYQAWSYNTTNTSLSDNSSTLSFTSAAGATPVLHIDNAINIKDDWGRDFNSNLSANVTVANASGVWINFTNAEFTNTSLGWLNLTLDEWVNESHNVNAPVTNVSVTVFLNSSSATNDSDSFYYEVTKRTNTATMDSAATQSANVSETFYVNATCNEEYGDTFLGGANLLEDGAIVDTDSSVTNYVNFSHSEAVGGIYNYTIRFYNLTHYNNGTTPTYSNVTVTEPTYIPPDPTNLQNTSGNYWVNYTWDEGTLGNITDLYNVSWNDTWYNDTSVTYMNDSVGAGNWANITVYAFNSSSTGTLSSGSVSDEVQMPLPYPVITLLSQYPSILYQNSTGYFNVSYMIHHSSVGLNNSSVSFVYTNYDTDDGHYNWSLRTSANNRSEICTNMNGEKILRSDNRNNTLNFENNATITGGNVYEWGGGDENVSRMSIVPINSTHTVIHWNGTITDTVSMSMWYLDRKDQQNATMTTYDIYKNNRLCYDIWDMEAINGHTNYLLRVYLDTHLSGASPNKPNLVYYCNNSFNPEGAINPEDSTDCFYVTSHNATSWVDYQYNVKNSSYIKLFTANQSVINCSVLTSKKAHICFYTEEASSKPYSVNITNSATTTNRSFAETNTTRIGGDAPLTENLYTTNAFMSYSHVAHQHQMKLFAADNNDVWSNSSLKTTDIEFAYYPPTTPVSNYFYFDGARDYDMNNTYNGTFDINVLVGNDPDGGETHHNLTLHYGNQTFVAIINDSFYDVNTTNGDINISFDSSFYYSTVDNYTLRIVATDDETKTSQSWLGVNFSLMVAGEDYIPPNPTNLANTTGNGWVNYTWDAGTPGNITNSYNVSWNSTWYNTTLVTFMNDTVGEFGWANITVWAYNSSGNGSLSTGNVTDETQTEGGSYTTTMTTSVYNLITYYGETNSSAEQFGVDIGNVDYVAKYNGSFYTHTMGFSANNFTTVHGIGYYVYLNASGSSIYSRNNISDSSYNTQLYNRWNTIGWTNATDTNAEGVAASIGSSCDYTSSLNADGITYTTHTVGFTSNNHAVEKGEGYWVWADSGVNWNRNS